MNKVILIGNLVAAPEMRRTQSDIACATFRLAVQRRFKKEDGTREADFINIVAWRQTAELCGKFLDKGSKCGVAGSIMTRTYDAQDGTKRYVTEVVAEEVEFLSRREEIASRNDNGAAQAEEWVQEDVEDELPF